MKNIKVTLLIVVAFLLGAITTNLYASTIRLIMVPEYIGNYKTVDLLEYLMKQKQKEDVSKKQQKVEEPAVKKSGIKTGGTKIGV